MTDRNKFEEMLERLVNEDKEGAEALFHEIVVEKSRDIYEGLLEDEEEVEETTDEEVDEATDEEVDESDEDLDESDDEDLDESDEELDEADEEVDENFFDVAEGDPVDDMMGDIEMPSADDGEMDMEPEMGDDDMGMGDEDGDVEDRVADLEDELESLKAEFEAMMGDEEGAGEEDGEDAGDMDMGGEMPMDMDAEDEPEEEAIAFESDEEVEEATDEEVEESAKSATEIMREYTDKVSATMGDNGANSKSTVAGKNDMGGTSANIAKGDTEAGVEANKGNLKGSALSDQNAKDMNTKNVNVPGAKGATKMSNQPGHGAEKKGAGETADKGAGSPLNGAPKRAK